MNPLMYDGFFTAVLARGGLAPDVPRLRYFRNQALAENSGADFNPLATEEPGGENPVRPLWNPQGVRNYAGWQEGVDATYATLAQSNFVALWQAIATETVTPEFVDAVHLWGTTDLEAWIRAGHDPFRDDFDPAQPETVPAAPAAPGPVDEATVKFWVIQALDDVASGLQEGSSFAGMIKAILVRLEAAGVALELGQPVPAPPAPPPAPLA